MESSKNRNYHIREIIYNIYEDNIIQIKTEINFISITDSYFTNYTEQFGHYMDLIGDAVNPALITSLMKQLDKAELKTFFNDIDEQ